MSPNESQLRAALRDGEGDTVDVDAVVLGAARLRRARRQRLTSAVGAVVVVAGIATGGAALLSRGDNGASSSSAALDRRSESADSLMARGSEPTASRAGAASASHAAGGTIRSGSSAEAKDATSAASSVVCPAQPPRIMLPGGGGTAQFGGAEPIYAQPVQAIKVCVYPEGAPPATSRVLVGAEAQALASSLNDAATTSTGRKCPSATTGLGAPTVVLFAFTPSHQQLRVVTAKVSCPGVATNGTAARYFWSPPSSVQIGTGLGVPIPSVDSPSR
jgi:hypothetical protein